MEHCQIRWPTRILNPLSPSSSTPPFKNFDSNLFKNCRLQAVDLIQPALDRAHLQIPSAWVDPSGQRSMVTRMGTKSSEPKSEWDTQSLTESVTDYPMENGRRYHRYHEGAYPYPNDEQELDRLDMQHHMFKLVMEGKLYHVPLKNPKQILDIGTGSGIWPIEMAPLFPNAAITGTDLSPVQPTEVPENVHFLVDDATEKEWLWEANHFDFIHVGHMTGAMKSFKGLLQKAFTHLKPGSYLECHEMDPKPKCDDGTMPPENPDGYSAYALHDWFDLHMRASSEVEPSRQFRIAPRIERWMKEIGFIDVEQKVFKVPINTWPTDEKLKDIGKWSESNWLEALAGWSYKPFLGLGWSKNEIEVFLVDVRKSIQDRNVHAYMDFFVVTGRKPLGDTKLS